MAVSLGCRALAAGASGGLAGLVVCRAASMILSCSRQRLQARKAMESLLASKARGIRVVLPSGEPVISPTSPKIATPSTIHVASRSNRLYPSQERTKWVEPKVDFSVQYMLVNDHYQCAAEHLLAPDYEQMTEGTQRSIIEDGALQIRKGIETGVSCVLDIEGVCHQGLDLCEQLRECRDWLPYGLVTRLHEARKVCNRCIHQHPDPAEVYGVLREALDALGALSAHLHYSLSDSSFSTL